MEMKLLCVLMATVTPLNFAERCRPTSGKYVAPDILFELLMPVTCSQAAFLGNHKKKYRFIFALIASLTHSDIKCRCRFSNL